MISLKYKTNYQGRLPLASQVNFSQVLKCITGSQRRVTKSLKSFRNQSDSIKIFSIYCKLNSG
jgi:hypothetical protein